ncbi:biotin/lipoyl-containing protein [Anaerolineales bacterium HSG24]|nr:biotin/lipoyl-containing protein [Anaerolineales bacterium HSG24]
MTKKLRVTINGVTYDVEVELLEDDEDPTGYGYAATNIYSKPPAPPPLPSAPPPGSPPPPPAPPATPKTGTNVLIAPLPGMVRDIRVKVGDAVKVNDPVIILEAMKMETVVSAPQDGTIAEINVEVSQNVRQDEVLATFASK